jgi:outer membrane protein
MRKIILTLLRHSMPGLLLCLTACLNETPHDQIAETEAYTNATDLYLNTIGNLYLQIGSNQESQGLQGTYRGVYDFNTFTTDEAMIPIRGGDWYDGGFWQRLYLHTWTPADEALYNTWKYLYKAVGLSNHALATITRHKDLLTPAQYNEYVAEARGLRALFYFYIMDMWGDIPLSMTDGTEANNALQTPRKEVAETLIRELQAAVPYLSPAHSNLQGRNYGCFTQPVAYFLLCKILLNNQVYMGPGTHLFTVDGVQMNAFEACIAYCQKITAAGYTLSADYKQNFAVHNETSNENIFTIPMDKHLYANEYQYFFRSRHYRHGDALGMGSENGTCATVATVNAYGYGTPNEDKRFAMNFYSGTVRVDGQVVRLSNGQPLVYEPLAARISLTGSPYEKTAGARMAKYEVDRTAYSDGRLIDNDIVLFRYADVLLMQAEALVRDGQNGDAEMNLVRQRVGMPPRQATLDNLLQERLLELMWEGWRRNDLIRFGKFQQAYDFRLPIAGENTGFTCLFPIPKNAIKQSPTPLQQNPGYH